jgi:predicted nucleic acid-binding protein
VVVVVDASVAIEVCLADALGPLEGHELVAPPLLASEVTSALSEMAYRSEVPAREARNAVAVLASLNIRYQHPSDLNERAWDLARSLGWAKTYDAEYVALAQILDAPLATIDERLRRAVKDLISVPPLTELESDSTRT